jgi:hypothetical protein
MANDVGATKPPRMTLKEAVRIRADRDHATPEQRRAADDVYFGKLGDFIEKHPIGVPRVRRR